MFIQVHEGEDRRTESFLGTGISRQASVVSQSPVSRQNSVIDQPEVRIARSESGTEYSEKLELESKFWL